MLDDDGDIDGAPSIEPPPSSDGTWPVGRAVLERFCGRPLGLQGISKQRRWQARPTLLYTDGSSIPSDKSFTRRYACHQKHPGLCYTKDGDTYIETLQLAKFFEQFFTAGHKHKFFHVFDVEATLGSLGVPHGPMGHCPMGPELGTTFKKVVQMGGEITDTWKKTVL